MCHKYEMQFVCFTDIIWCNLLLTMMIPALVQTAFQYTIHYLFVEPTSFHDRFVGVSPRYRHFGAKAQFARVRSNTRGRSRASTVGFFLKYNI